MMMFWIKLAFKNILRKRERTFLTLIPLVFGTAILIFVSSMLEGVNNDSKMNLKNFETAHFRIVHRDFDNINKQMGLQKTFVLSDDIRSFLDSSELIGGYAQEITFTGNLSDGISKMPVICRGVDYSSYKKTFLTLDKTVPLIEGFSKRVVLIGEDVFKLYEMPFDSVFFLESRTSGGTFDAMDLNFIAQVATGNPKVDRTSIYIDIKDAKSFLNTGEEITGIAIKLKSDRNLTEFVEKIKPVLLVHPELKMISWEEMAADIMAIDSAKKYSSSIIVFIVLIIGGVGIANTILLSVYERLREIGTMRALGASDSVLLKMFVFEGSAIGFTGSVLGIMLGVVFMALISFIGIDMSMFVKDMDIGYPIKSVFRGRFDLMIALRSGFYAFIVGVIASLYPAYRAVKENIVRMLK